MKDDGAKGVELSGGQSFRSGERQSRPGFTFAPEPEQTSPGGQSVSKSLGEKINLGLKPEELESYLDAYVIRQDQAKATLATKICTHFNRIRYLDESGVKDAPSSVGMIKNNRRMDQGFISTKTKMIPDTAPEAPTL